MSVSSAKFVRRLCRIRPWRGILALIGLVLVVRLAWGWWVGRQYQAELDAIRARGEPVEVADVKYAAVPDAENAWLVQEQAAAGIVVDSPANSDLDYRNYPPYPAKWFALAEASEKAHRQVFTLARQARRLSCAQVSGRLRSPMAFVPFTNLLPAQTLAQTIKDGAIYAHTQGDDAEAIERICDLLHLSRSLHHGDWMVDQLVASGIDVTACRAARVIGPGLRLHSSAATRPATAQQARGLIDQLLDEEAARAGFRRSLLIERLLWIDVTRQEARGSWFIHPLAERQICRNLTGHGIHVSASRCGSWPEAKALLDQWRDAQDEVIARPRLMFGAGAETPRYSRWFALPIIELNRYFPQHFRVLAERRTTAVALACQLYRSERGRWPERLEELVPGYLPAVPSDPFHADGRPIGYLVLKGQLPGGGDRPMLSFDAGAAGAPVPAEPCYGWTVDPQLSRDNGATRQYRDLARFVPPGLEEAVDDDPQKADAPGEEPQKDDEAQ